MSNGGATREPTARRALLTYNVLRLLLFGVCLGLGWLAGLRSILLIVVALLVSGALSWFWLRPQREAMGRAVEQTVERSRVRFAEHTAREDAYVEAALAEPVPTPPPAPNGDQPAS